MMNEKQQIEEMAKVIASVPPIEFPIGSRMQGRHIYTATKIAEHLYNADYRKQEWISVDERLPEEDGRYLVFIKVSFFEDMTILRILEYNKSQGFNVYSVAETVTHWLPLPDAPKMKGGAE